MDRIARIAPSARLEQQIEELLTNGLGEGSEHLAELGRLGARLVLQRAVDEEVPRSWVVLATSARQRRPVRAMAHGRSRSRPPKARSASPCPRSEAPPSSSLVA